MIIAVCDCLSPTQQSRGWDGTVLLHVVAHSLAPFHLLNHSRARLSQSVVRQSDEDHQERLQSASFLIYPIHAARCRSLWTVKNKEKRSGLLVSKIKAAEKEHLGRLFIVQVLRIFLRRILRLICLLLLMITRPRRRRRHKDKELLFRVSSIANALHRCVPQEETANCSSGSRRRKTNPEKDKSKLKLEPIDDRGEVGGRRRGLIKVKTRQLIYRLFFNDKITVKANKGEER